MIELCMVCCELRNTYWDHTNKYFIVVIINALSHQNTWIPVVFTFVYQCQLHEKFLCNRRGGAPCTRPWLGPNYMSPYVGSASVPARYFKICVISVLYLILDYSISSIFTTCPYPYILGISPFYLWHLCGWADHSRFIGGIWTLLRSHNKGRPM